MAINQEKRRSHNHLFGNTWTQIAVEASNIQRMVVSGHANYNRNIDVIFQASQPAPEDTPDQVFTPNPGAPYVASVDFPSETGPVWARASENTEDDTPSFVAVQEEVSASSGSGITAPAGYVVAFVEGTSSTANPVNIAYTIPVGKRMAGFHAMIQHTNGNWVNENFGDKDTEAANYFQALYNETSDQFELYAVGSGLENSRPVRIIVHLVD